MHMASVPILFLLFFAPSLAATTEQNQSNSISPGSSLSPTIYPTSWPSPSGLFAFGFYRQGNGFAVGIWLVGQHNNTVVWTANRDDPPVSSNATLDFTKDGKLLLRMENGDEKSIAELQQPAVSASVLNSGNFVLYDNNSNVIWDSFGFPTDTILGGQSLLSSGQLVSSELKSDHSSGRFFLSMQSDGNLVAYPINSSSGPDDSYWSSDTSNAGFAVQLKLSDRGLLGLYRGNSSIRTVASSSNPGRNSSIIYRATLDSDGIFRLYSHSFESNTSSNVSIEWTALPDQCMVHGFCGFNSYCSGMGIEADCYCFPGFNFIDPSKKFQGCYRRFDEDGCRGGKNPAVPYNSTALENLWWADYPYSVVLMKKEDCKWSCLEDCNCGAALYVSNSCRKHKLPLRYAVRNQNRSATAFFKVILGNREIEDQGPSTPMNPIVKRESKRTLILILAICLGFVACLSFAIAIFSFIVYRHRVHRYAKLAENAALGLTEEFTLRSFTYDELEKATGNFKEELGRGAFGAVYKGTVSVGKTINVAVIRLEKIVEEGEREFRAEITAIAQTHHKNLVRLLGFCINGTRKLLVYEYMSNGSLADLLFKAERRPIWKERMRIALDVARGILYLHEECEARIIHCNIKPQNILLDDSWTAKISDFGLAKLLMPNRTRTGMGVNSVSEYLAPEWQKNVLISDKADIYSFGIVLLEIVSCRSNIEVNVSTADEIVLSTWVSDCFVAGELNKLVGDENVDLKTLERMVKVGLWCIQEDPDMRPSMKNVILMLEGTVDIPVLPSPASSLVIS